jgi:LacI family transcriptional regulator
MGGDLMNQRRVTLADIARQAGVHVTTVSLALRSHPRLPETTRRRIQALARELGYRPDPWLRALVAYRGNISERRNIPTLAYVTNWNTRLGWKKATAHPEFHAGAEAMANQLGYRLEHFWLQEPGLTPGRLGRMLHARGINGIILASHGRERGDAVEFEWQNFSAVKIDYYPHRPVLHNVTNNQCDIIRVAMQKVKAAGYRRLGFVMHRGWDHAVDHLWTAGYLCEQQHLGARERIPAHIFPAAQPVERWFNESDTPVEADLESFSRWFDRHRPEVIISKGSFVLPLLERMRLKVPQDVAFADVFLEELSGATAGVRQKHRTVGATAVELLAAQLQHNRVGLPGIPTTTFVEGTWFDGRSCPPKTKSAAPRNTPAVKQRA